MLQRLWSLLCSLKLAIWLASIATVLTMAGSIVMIKYPKTFGDIDQMTLAEWFNRYGWSRPALSWWLIIAISAFLLLALNTLCCFCDWAGKIRARWRKCGEYLLHLGFVLVAVALVWGAISGSRSEGNAISVGATHPLDPLLPGHALRLDAFEPVFTAAGQFSDMRSTLTVLKDNREILQQVISINHPLTIADVVILPATFSQIADGVRFRSAAGPLDLRAGTIVPLAGGSRLRVITFYPDALRGGDGRVYPRGSELGQPAFEFELVPTAATPWRGWYLVGEATPPALAAYGLFLQPEAPLSGYASVLTVNRDPGIHLATAGGLCMTLGVILTLFSFYAKRRSGDRPDII